jgi:hypothetical protein
MIRVLSLGMSPFNRCVACFPLPSSGYRGRSLRKPCGSPPSPVLWGRKTAQPSLRASFGRPLGCTYLPTQKRRSSWCGREMGSSLGFPASLFGSMPRARDSADSSTTSPSGCCRMLPSASGKGVGIGTITDFGAESSRPASSLCTLRTHQSPGEWQHSLLTCLLDFGQTGFAPARLD